LNSIDINVLFGYVEYILLDGILSNEQFDNQTKEISYYCIKSILLDSKSFFFNALYSTIIIYKSQFLCIENRK
jgi:hypothetical protein